MPKPRFINRLKLYTHAFCSTFSRKLPATRTLSGPTLTPLAMPCLVSASLLQARFRIHPSRMTTFQKNHTAQRLLKSLFLSVAKRIMQKSPHMMGGWGKAPV